MSKIVLSLIRNHIRAKRILKSIGRKYCGFKIVYALPHLGDIVLGLAYLENLKNEKILVVAPVEMKDLISLYKCYFTECIFLNKKQISILQYCASNLAISSVFTHNENNIVTFPYMYFNGNIINSLSGAVLFSIRYAYGLDPEKDYKISYPLVPNISKSDVMALLGCSEEQLNDVIIISPYAQSCPPIPLKIWDSIIARLKVKGYNIYSNVTRNQVELQGSKRLQCSLIELYNICKYVNCFLGVRSGIFDFIISSNCPLLAIYTNVDSIRSYSLKQWFVNNSIRDLKYIGDDDYVINQTVNFVVGIEHEN